MSMSNDSINDNSSGAADGEPSGAERQHAGNSGEGAASALAQLKTQTRQHRRLSGDANDDAAEGPGQ